MSFKKKVLLVVVLVLPLLVTSVSTENLSWEAFWGSSGFDVATAVALDTVAMAQDSLANIYIAGARAPGPFGGYDAFIASFDRFGVLRWETFWGSRVRYDTASALVVDDYGNLYIAGVTSPGEFGAFDVFVASFNSSGDFRWEAFWGTAGYEWASGVAVDHIGNVYVAGRTSGVYYPGPWNAFLVSFNSSGGFRWEAFWGTPNGYDRADAIAVDTLGNIYIGGRTGQGEVFGQPFEAFLVSYDTFGSLRWEVLWGKQACDFVYGIALDSLGNIFIAGVTYVFGPFGVDDAFLVSFNSSGGFRWEAFWGKPVREVAYGVTLDPLGNAYIAGYVYPGPVGGEDAFVVSFDRFGVFLWEAFWGRSGNDRAFGVAFDQGNVYIAGWTNPGPLGGYDAFIAGFATQSINATVEINPETLDVKSNEDFVTTFIELPQGYDVQDIRLETIRLEDIEAITDPAYGFVRNPKAYLVDRDKDGILERLVKFDRQTLIDYLETRGISDGEVTLTITGKVGEQSFEGKDSIRIISE